MAKYSFEIKKEVVEAYLRGDSGSDYIAKKYNLPRAKTVREWVAYYKADGDEGLTVSRQKRFFPVFVTFSRDTHLFPFKSMT